MEPSDSRESIGKHKNKIDKIFNSDFFVNVWFTKETYSKSIENEISKIWNMQNVVNFIFVFPDWFMAIRGFHSPLLSISRCATEGNRVKKLFSYFSRPKWRDSDIPKIKSEPSQNAPPFCIFGSDPPLPPRSKIVEEDFPEHLLLL